MEDVKQCAKGFLDNADKKIAMKRKGQLATNNSSVKLRLKQFRVHRCHEFVSVVEK